MSYGVHGYWTRRLEDDDERRYYLSRSAADVARYASTFTFPFFFFFGRKFDQFMLWTSLREMVEEGDQISEIFFYVYS